MLFLWWNCFWTNNHELFWNSSGDGLFTPSNTSLSTTYYPGLNDINNGFCWIFPFNLKRQLFLPDKDSVYVQFTPSPSVDTGANQIICTNDAQIQLNGSITGGATTGVWSGGASFSPSNTALNTVYTPTPAEISSGNIALTLTATNFGNCNTVNDVVQFIFVAPPHANFSAANNCFGDSSNFVNFSLAGMDPSLKRSGILAMETVQTT
ncbi:MAG: hypothetical protein R2779_02975 [Crocinitomicaceae bacterium]